MSENRNFMFGFYYLKVAYLIGITRAEFKSVLIIAQR